MVKANGKWRMCVDFTDLNDACPKDCLSLPKIDTLIDATAAHKMLSFMDGFSGYNQIKMHKDDIPKDLIGKTMEFYVEHMLVKSLVKTDHITHLREAFEVLRRVAALGRFISKSGDKCLSFFKSLKKVKDFVWSEESENAFEELKKYMAQASLLAKPALNEVLYLYLAVSESALSSVLVKEELKIQKPVYYVSKILHGVELNYSTIEKFDLALVMASRKLRSYFQAHQIEVLTNQPLRNIIHSPKASGRLIKWAIELGEFDIKYKS
ncbi:hypothetical protein AgCh_000514 [Apium graveolens]